jgi:OFA family oxalate/formate antiporter-like MFS transporter
MLNQEVNQPIKTKPRFFYGWWIVGASFFINLCIGGVIHFGFTAFFEPIASEFGWSYAQVSLAASLRGLEMGILSPVAGLAVDRYGPRKLVFGGAILIGLGLMLLSRVSTLAMFYGAFILIAMGASTCTGVVLMAAVAYWFRRKVSLALGITISGSSAGGLIIPLATRLIDVFGWRMAILSLGLGICGLILVLSSLLRHKPEQYGYLPDGALEGHQIAEQPVATAQAPGTEPKVRSKQVLASRTFWHISLSLMCCILPITAVTTHIMPYLSSIGINRTISSLLASIVPLVTIAGRIGFGWLGDRFDKKRLTAMTSIGIGFGMLLFICIAIGGIWLILPFIIFFSISYGGNAAMMPVLVRTYFGGSNFGTTLGLVMGVSVVGMVLGPTLAGWVFDTSGSYLGAWIGGVILAFMATVIIATIPPVTTSAQLADK